VTTKLRLWTEEGNKRVHGTTKRIPLEVFGKEEKPKLPPLPSSIYEMCQAGTRLVHHDCYIFVENNYYSIPFRYVGKEVDIERADTLVRIFCKGQQSVAFRSTAISDRLFGLAQSFPLFNRACMFLPIIVNIQDYLRVKISRCKRQPLFLTLPSFNMRFQKV
jgi:hypothetical protein